MDHLETTNLRTSTNLPVTTIIMKLTRSALSNGSTTLNAKKEEQCRIIHTLDTHKGQQKHLTSSDLKFTVLHMTQQSMKSNKHIWVSLKSGFRQSSD
jgi:hypothetical protein